MKKTVNLTTTVTTKHYAQTFYPALLLMDY